MPIAPVLLPHLEGRPLTLKRYPNGVEGRSLLREELARRTGPTGSQTATVQMASKTIDFCSREDVPTLVWLGNLADLELHTSLSLRRRTPQRPTMLAFDLDPGAPATIVECCRVGAVAAGDVRAASGLQSFAKTSGSKGLQVYVPLNNERDVDATRETKTFAKAVAELLEQPRPATSSSRGMTKTLRPGKVLVDWCQNDDAQDDGQRLLAARQERPTVSTPVTWDEVARVRSESGDPETCSSSTPTQVLERVARDGDLFGDAVSLVQELPSL